MNRHLFFTAVGLIACLTLSVQSPSAFSDEDERYDQSKVPLEVDTTDPALTKIVLVAGRRSHGPLDHEFFSGCAILMNMLKQTPGVFPVMARDGWPKNPKIFAGAKSLVFYMDGGANHPVIQQGRMNELQKYLDQKVGFVNIHYAVEYPKAPDIGGRLLTWLGGYYETGYSTNPHWVADIKSLPDHPITRGVKPFSIRDEWYFNIRFPSSMRGITPILKATPPDDVRRTPAAKQHSGREETLAWAFERPDGGRSFGFTGAHSHRNWGDENFRRVVVNAILWSAGVEVPPTGAKVDFDQADLMKNLDDKRKPRSRN